MKRGKQCEVLSIDMMNNEMTLRTIGQGNIHYQNFNDIELIEDIKLSQIIK
jgi:hypothetical protein